MKFLKLLGQIGILSVFYLVGVWIQEAFNLFIPGSLIGMFLLFLLLMIKKVKVSWISNGSNYFMKHMAILFIPVTVGLINYLDVFVGKGLLLVPIALISTFLVIIVSGAVSQSLVKKTEKVNEKVNAHELNH